MKNTRVYTYMNPLERWLFSHGGRTLNDVCESEDGAYVIMWDGFCKRESKVRIPRQFLDRLRA